jgi:hypothetical protein
MFTTAPSVVYEELPVCRPQRDFSAIVLSTSMSSQWTPSLEVFNEISYYYLIFVLRIGHHIP